MNEALAGRRDFEGGAGDLGLCRFGCVIAHVALLAFALAGHAQRPPAAEHHAHLQSPEAARLLSSSSNPEDEAEEPHTARDLIAALDAADVHESVALSDAYRFGAPWLHLPDEAAAVDRENAWTAAQAAQYPARLVAFCSVNPLKPYAEAAIRRCHALGIQVFSDALGQHERVEDYQKAMDWGIDLIQTDHPLRVMRAIEVRMSRESSAAASSQPAEKGNR